MAASPTLRQLRHLVALADHGHFGRAAAAAAVTQSTLSASIKELETVLEAALVDRTRRQVVLTPLGRQTVERARRILVDTESLVLAARRARTADGHATHGRDPHHRAVSPAGGLAGVAA